ncbi:MAG TPA: hypothetical protein VEH27_07195, partial [Methylomirabilota bacterium]|nr:hypothetical protein [Methylomirabilota bacterium]
QLLALSTGQTKPATTIRFDKREMRLGHWPIMPSARSRARGASGDAYLKQAAAGKADRAAKLLDALYSAGYQALQRQQGVEGIFVSDCGILFVRREGNLIPERAAFSALCDVLFRVHYNCMRQGVQIATSLAFGPFSYREKIEFPGVEKNALMGGAYIAAYLDQATGKPKLYPPECRVLKDRLPETVATMCATKTTTIGSRLNI